MGSGSYAGTERDVIGSWCRPHIIEWLRENFENFDDFFHFPLDKATLIAYNVIRKREGKPNKTGKDERTMTKTEIIDILTALAEERERLWLRDRETEHGKMALGRVFGFDEALEILKQMNF